MEINKRIVWKETADSKIVDGKLLTPNQGVAYVVDQDKVLFNKVVLPQGNNQNNEQGA